MLYDANVVQNGEGGKGFCPGEWVAPLARSGVETRLLTRKSDDPWTLKGAEWSWNQAHKRNYKGKEVIVVHTRIDDLPNE